MYGFLHIWLVFATPDYFTALSVCASLPSKNSTASFSASLVSSSEAILSKDDDYKIDVMDGLLPLTLS